MSNTLYAECTVVHTCSVFTAYIGAGPAETRFDSVRALAMMMDDYNSEEDLKRAPTVWIL